MAAYFFYQYITFWQMFRPLSGLLNFFPPCQAFCGLFFPNETTTKFKKFSPLLFDRLFHVFTKSLKASDLNFRNKVQHAICITSLCIRRIFPQPIFYQANLEFWGFLFNYEGFCHRWVLGKSTKSSSKYGAWAQMLARMIVEFSQHDLNDCDCSTLGAVANSSGLAVSSYQKEKFGLNTEKKLPINTVLCCCWWQIVPLCFFSSLGGFVIIIKLHRAAADSQYLVPTPKKVREKKLEGFEWCSSRCRYTSWNMLGPNCTYLGSIPLYYLASYKKETRGPYQDKIREKFTKLIYQLSLKYFISC